MVTIRLNGGLGNQLFQYATGRALAERTATNLVMDISHYETVQSDTNHLYFSLSNFDISAKISYEPTTRKLNRLRDSLIAIGSKWVPELTVRFFGEYHETTPLRYDRTVHNLPGDVCLDGYWQSEKYFAGIAERLRSELSVTCELSGANREWADRIGNANAVSVHFRRGDYEELGWTLPTDYYRRALAEFTSEYDHLDLFAFSDDLDWVRANADDIFAVDGLDTEVHYVDANGAETAHEDIRLMRMCDHNIIANSSFSWWGAWLNESDGKTVVSPYTWAGFDEHVAELDNIPERWTVVRW